MSRFKEIKRYYSLKFMNFIKGNGGFGLNEFLGIAAALIVAALVVIPGLRGFSEDVMTGLKTWWDKIASRIFQENTTAW
ncbi:MAG TPA: hypothetical protein GXX20_10240 [Clostridiaceae bacterium]|nr:hypothetical protein [Clostridiaceae bacterium]